ncbi:MAG: EamA family transporter, partial [Pyrinomonadaceae bacterium]|nr:EamA family transporter [Pyrinomonadaceae bacterium]
MDWLAYALLSALFAGLVAIFGKVGVRGVDSTVATMVRSCVMALALIALASTRRGTLESVRMMSSRAWMFILLAGLAGAASWLCYFRALQLGDAARVAPIDRLSVLITIIFAALFLGEKITGGIALDGLLMLAGALLI